MSFKEKVTRRTDDGRKTDDGKPLTIANLLNDIS